MSLNMPNSYCTLLVLIFLCLYLHACNARPLADIAKTKLEKKLHIFNKNDAKKGLEKVQNLPKAKSSLSSTEVIGAERGEMIAEKSFADRTQKPKDLTKKVKTTSGAVQTESLTSVSWRVPHNKRSEKHPGFNSDYSPPKTHPPSHN